MSSVTTYTSRKGTVPCTDKELYNFVTDMRNFEGLIPRGIITDWTADEDSCSFRVTKTGKITAQLSEAIPYSMVDYVADTFMTGKVSASLLIRGIDEDNSEVSVTVSATLNPVVKMILGDSVNVYLEKLIRAVEEYDGYDRIRKYSRSL